MRIELTSTVKNNFVTLSKVHLPNPANLIYEKLKSGHILGLKTPIELSE